ncbi:DUF2330 domain-containing protein [Tsukamurella paurometabola]|uniref:DUF2330 domain-containing protein n=1 Tax=Tsukamurella paurometabola TaxID=2061 RepID=A0ABS5NDA6_TSUPA|nr:DUF2330 domain-containing protein [Tsukamurella paurometabola]MBS4102260.1 DUF2330 domain-containing protein [Tsukamurella paurometabola]
MAHYSESRGSRAIRRLLALSAALLVAVALPVAAPASHACACGAPAMPDGIDATATQELALLSWDGRTETIEMSLDLHSAGDHGALVVPTPAPATITSGSRTTFQELARTTAPRRETRRRIFGVPSLPLMSATPFGDGTPLVLARMRLGPVEAVTLQAGSTAGLQKWLRENGFTLRPEVAATLGGYVADGWSFTALRLVGEDLRGALQPLRMTFASTALVYPMRMSRAARTQQQVTLYFMGPHRVARTDADRSAQTERVDFAGRVRPQDPRLAELARGGDYLTALTYAADPARITRDFTFGRAPSDEPHQRVIVEYVSDGRSMMTTLAVITGAAAALGILTGLAARAEGRRRIRGEWR